MIENKHLELRQAFYHAWGAYHRASADYWDAVSSHLDLESIERAVTVRTAADALDTALTDIRVYLNHQEVSPRLEDERRHMIGIQELLQHELALLLNAE